MSGLLSTGSLGAPVRREIPSAMALAGIALLAALIAVTGLALPSPTRYLLPALVALSGVAVFARRQPAVAVAWLPVLMVPPEFAKVFAYEVVLVIVAGTLFLSGLYGRRSWVWRLDPIEVTVAGLLLWAGSTLLWSNDLWWFTFQWRKHAVGLVGLWAAWRIGRWIPRETLFTGIVAGGAGVACLALYVAATVGLAGGGMGSRTESTNIGWANSNSVAALLALMLPTALLTALHARGRQARILGWVALITMPLVAAAAASRGGAVMMALAVVLMVLDRRLGRRALMVFGVVTLMVVGLVAGPGGRRLVERFTSPEGQYSLVVRLIYMREAWRRLLLHLPWGIGLGQGLNFPDKMNHEDPHNYWLVIAPELGLPGLFLWIAILVLIWRRTLKMARDPRFEPAARALQVTLLVSQLNCLFEPTFQNLQYTFMFYWIVGVYLGHSAGRIAPAITRPEG